MKILETSNNFQKKLLPQHCKEPPKTICCIDTDLVLGQDIHFFARNLNKCENFTNVVWSFEFLNSHNQHIPQFKGNQHSSVLAIINETKCPENRWCVLLRQISQSSDTQCTYQRSLLLSGAQCIREAAIRKKSLPIMPKNLKQTLSTFITFIYLVQYLIIKKNYCQK